MYFVSYTTNKLEAPQNGFNVWRVKENKLPPGNNPSFTIQEVLVGGVRRPDTKRFGSMKANHIFENEEDVIEQIFKLANEHGY